MNSRCPYHRWMNDPPPPPPMQTALDRHPAAPGRESEPNTNKYVQPRKATQNVESQVVEPIVKKAKLAESDESEPQPGTSVRAVPMK